MKNASVIVSPVAAPTSEAPEVGSSKAASKASGGDREPFDIKFALTVKRSAVAPSGMVKVCVRLLVTFGFSVSVAAPGAAATEPLALQPKLGSLVLVTENWPFSMLVVLAAQSSGFCEGWFEVVPSSATPPFARMPADLRTSWMTCASSGEGSRRSPGARVRLIRSLG